MSQDSKQNDHRFIIDDEDRYSRLRLIGWWEQEKISAARVLIIGAGALGNEVLKNLALLGIGQIIVVDFDEVQPSNLSRSLLFRASDAGQSKANVAAQRAHELNPDCQVVPMHGDVMTVIGLGLVRDVDVVICCVDNREARLWINRLCWKVGTPWIDGGIQEINGVAKVFTPPDGPCYECGMTEKDYQLIQLRYSCPLLKQEDIQQGKIPTAPTIASIIGGLQSQEALKIIHSMSTDTGTAMVFNGAANNFYKSKYPYREDCLSHEFYEGVVEGPLGAAASTVSELFDFVEQNAGSEAEAIELDRDFLAKMECRSCGLFLDVNRPRNEVGVSESICEQCGENMIAESLSEVAKGEFMNRTLREMGIPDYDIVKVRTNNGYEYILLEDDRPKGC
ncbi:MAG: ThiF family adenylyltransferase [Planctomycetota bacterium]